MDQTSSKMAIALTSSILKTSLSLPKSAKPRRNPSTVVLVSCRSTSAMDTSLSVTKSTNFYEMLSLSSKSASMDDVKRAFRSMALRYHPDVCDPSAREESTRMFVMLHEAYRTLSDPVLREEYNYSLGFIRRPRSEGGNRMVSQRRWEEQVMELKRRSSRREGRRRVGTWGSLMRSRNTNNNNRED